MYTMSYGDCSLCNFELFIMLYILLHVILCCVKYYCVQNEIQ